MESRRELMKHHVEACQPGENFVITFHGLVEFKRLVFEFRKDTEVIQVLNESPGGHNHYHVVFRRKI